MTIIEQTTNQYWNNWIRRSTYEGSWKEAVHRSALALKLLIFEPTGMKFIVAHTYFHAIHILYYTGAVVASPTFSLPEYIGGTRNWDYRLAPSNSKAIYAHIITQSVVDSRLFVYFICPHSTRLYL